MKKMRGGFIDTTKFSLPYAQYDVSQDPSRGMVSSRTIVGGRRSIRRNRRSRRVKKGGCGCAAKK
jgi:hypothetical protein